MPTQIDFKKDDPNVGNVKGKLRIKGKDLFFKFNQSEVAQQMIAKMQSGGAIITPGRKWIKVNMFGNHEEVKMGNNVFEPKEKTSEELEIILTEFYQAQYTRAGFEVETKKI